MRALAILAVMFVAVGLCGCATVAGTATGALTGMVDFPAETYRHNQEDFQKYPILYGLDVLVIGPAGIITGPVMGFVKGVSLDTQWVVGHVDYGEVFGSYDRASIWRPHTVKWRTKPERMAE